MVSTYGYGTVAGLEALTGTDYSAVNALYVDAVLEANLSSAERKINGRYNTSWVSTIPDGVVDATYMIAAKLMKNMMIENGEVEGEINLDFFDVSVLQSLSAIENQESKIQSVWWI